MSTGRPDISPPAATSLVERLRAVHLQMLDAVLTGDGLAAVADLAAIASGDERIGGVVLLQPGRPEPEAVEFLHLAAVAALTEVAVEEAREEVEENVRGSFLEELRERPDGLDAADVVRRAGRLGCDLSAGAVVLCAELTSERPRHVVALISSEYAGALAQHVEGGASGRVYALLPAVGDADQAATMAAAPALAGRLQRHGVVALSS